MGTEGVLKFLWCKPRNPPSVAACALDLGVDATAAARSELRSRLPFTAVHRMVQLKAIRIVVPTVLGELRCGHITSVSLGWAGVSCFGIVSGRCAVCYDGRGVR